MIVVTGEMTNDVKVMLGDPKKAMFIMASPIFVSLIVGQINSIVDTYWCSSLGLNALSAVGIVSSLYFLLNGIGQGLGLGLSISIAKRIGAKEKDVAERIASQGIVFIFCISVVVTPLFLIFGEPIISMIGSEVAYSESIAYAYPYFLSGCVLFIHSIFAGLLRAEGAVKKSTTILILSVLFNLLLDPIFAYTFGLGIAGLAWASVVSTFLSALPALYWYFIKRSTYIYPNFTAFRFESPLIMEFLRLGVPKMIELNIMSVINLGLVHFLIVGGGEVGVALYNTTWKYVNLLLVPSQALGGGLVPICAAAYGGGDFKKVRGAYNFSLIVSLSITTVAAFFVATFSDQFAILFTSSGSAMELREGMVHTIRLFCIFIPFYGWINMASSLLQAIYMADRSMYSTLIRNILLIMVFWYTSTLNLEAMWWGLILCEIAGGFLMGSLAEYGLLKKMDTFQRRFESNAAT